VEEPGSPLTLDEGGTASIDLKVTEPGVDALTATIDWGDSTTTAGTIYTFDGSLYVKGSHQYKDDDLYFIQTVRGRIRPGGGGERNRGSESPGSG